MSNTRSATHRWWMAAFAVLALLAASCSSSDGDSEAVEAEGGGEEAEPAAEEPSESAPEESTSSEPAEEPAEEAPAEPVELTASFRGVSEDTIKIGYTSVDFDKLRDQFQVDLNHQSASPVIEVLVDELNERGGINGRQVEVITKTYLPVGGAEAETICTELTEDEEVFAVLNGFAGPGAEDVNPCFTELHDTILVGNPGKEAEYERATAPWIAQTMNLDRRVSGFITAAEREGVLPPTVAVWLSNPAQFDLEDHVVAELEAAGVDVVATGLMSSEPGDVPAASAEVQTFVELAKNEGAEGLFWMGNSPEMYRAIISVWPEAPVFNPVGDQIAVSVRDVEGVADATLYGGGIFPKAWTEDESLVRCLEIVEPALGITVTSNEETPDTEPNWWQPVAQSCLLLELFELIATAAGPDLTNDSFAEAAENLGTFDVVGPGTESLAPGKRDVIDAVGIGLYEIGGDMPGDFVMLGDLVIAD